MSEPAIAQPVSQSIAIRGAAGGGVEHLAVDGIVSLSGIKPFGRAPGAFACTAQVQEEQQDRCGGEDQAQRFAPRGRGSGANRSPLAPFPVVEPCMDRDGDAN